MASSSVAMSPSAQPDWRKMNKQALRDALASRGLDTTGLRPSLIQRLESSTKVLAVSEALAAASADKPTVSPLEAPQKDSVGQIDSQSQEVKQTCATAVLTLQEGKVTGECTDSNVAAKSHEGQGKRVAENETSEQNSLNKSNLTEFERKRLRAERFGVGLQVSEQEKLALRAERFAGPEGKKSSNAKDLESERRKQRAARFGILDEGSRKKTCQEQFASTTKEEKSSEAEKRKARAARFGTVAEGTEVKH